MKLWSVLALVIASDSIGNLFISRGMKRMGPIALGNLHDLPGTLKKIFSNLFLWGGVLFFTVAFFSFLTLLSWANLSFVLPATALSYLVNTFAARFVLNERVPVGRWLGTIFIGMGVALLSLGPIAVR